MRIVTRIRYREDRSEPLLLGSRAVEVVLRPGPSVTIRTVRGCKPLVSMRCRSKRAAKVAARRWLSKAGASLGYEVRKKL